MMEITLWHLLDSLLAILLLGLAWSALSGTDLKRGVVLFMAFGLLLSLIWARLRAPDLALAEAAIGAGLSGALLLLALRDREKSERKAGQPMSLLRLATVLLTLLLAASFALAYVTAVTSNAGGRLAGLAFGNLEQSGVSNPVTAVLLNFRAYDTLLELAVLLAATLGILALGSERRPFRRPGVLLAALVTWISPLLVIVAGYLLWTGAVAPGGAFQAGALLAAAIVMLRLGGMTSEQLPHPLLQRWLLAGGIAAFMLAGYLATFHDLAFLQYPAGWAGLLILLIESAATLSIALSLGLAYLGGSPSGWDDRSSRGKRS
jgi:multisubunit Na+/H+ antiporter MnhB subunit